jgi:uncharacterized membrane protein
MTRHGGTEGEVPAAPHSHSIVDAPASDVPFAGLRRNALAIAGGLLIFIALWLVPDLTPPPEVEPPVRLVHGQIVEFLPASDDPGPDVRVRVLAGELRGEILEGYVQGPSGQQALPDYSVGDEVIVGVSTEPESVFIAVSDRWRVPALVGVLALFATAVTIVGGWRGIRSLLALALTLAVVIKIVVPLLLAGWDPVGLAVVSASAVTVVTFLLTEGARRSTLAAALGTFLALGLTAALAVLATELAGFTEFQGSEDIAFLGSMGRSNLDLGGLLLAAVIFGALGVLDDVTVTQAATVHELYEADHRVSRWQLFRRAMNVGRSHIAATVNTLVLAYVGASLPLLVLFAAGRQEPLLIASLEVVAVEVMRALVGSIGIVAAVPVTTLVAAAIMGRRIPFIGDGSGGRRASGWG